jgi:hypothetical protein
VRGVDSTRIAAPRKKKLPGTSVSNRGEVLAAGRPGAGIDVLAPQHCGGGLGDQRRRLGHADRRMHADSRLDLDRRAERCAHPLGDLAHALVQQVARRWVEAADRPA